MVGRTFKHYRVTERLGAGGMGEVYRAMDLELDREVALKVLPESVSHDAERLDRFRREARAVAALDHPNIVTIHSIEEDAGVRFLIMELIDGKPLDRLIPEGGLPLERFFALAVPLVDALATAHRAGITHRDLKPANIMVGAGGDLKVLDFGLAKLEGREPVADGSQVATEQLTRAGQVLGTVPYMSPEQLVGDAVDPRSDIFSLGVVLWEMLTGSRPFQGRAGADLASRILRDPPPAISTARPDCPPRLAGILERCLEKSPEERFQSAGDLHDELAALAEASSHPHRAAAVAGPARRGRGALAVGLVLVAAAVVGSLWLRGRALEAPAPGAPSEGAGLDFAGRRLSQLTFGSELEEWPAWSPDGGRLLYSAEVEGFKNLFVRELASGETRRLTAGAADDIQGSWSPDGAAILFVRSNQPDGKLEPADVYGSYWFGDTWRITVADGSEARLVENAVNPAYSPDGKRIAVEASWAGPARIWTVDARGHNPRQVTTDSSEAIRHSAPSWSPDGEHLAYRRIEQSKSDIQTIDLARQEQARVTDDAHLDLHPVWSPDGSHIYFTSARGGGLNLWRIPVTPQGIPTGVAEQLTSGPGADVQLAVAPGGTGLAFSILQQNADLWRLPLSPTTGAAAGPPEPLVATTREDSRGAWAPDSRSIAFNSDRDGDMNLWVRDPDGSERQITRGTGGDYQPAWSPDGKSLLFFSARAGNADIWRVDLASQELTRLTRDPALDVNPFPSPDGRWIAFHSDREGRQDVWVMAADGSEPRRLSTRGALSHFMRWSDDSGAVFFTAEAPGGRRTYRLPLAGGEPEPLPPIASGGHFSFSPDRALALDVAGHKSLWVYPLDAGEPRLVFEFAEPRIRLDYPSWSPDGRWVIFDRVEPRGGDVWLLEGLR